MKLFFISDIHGNQFALESILNFAEGIGSDHIFCAGDLSGYFTGINQVVALLKKYKVNTILGNHDAFLTGALTINQEKLYYPSFIKTKDIITSYSYDWIKSLPAFRTYQTDKITIKAYHGGPTNPLIEYVYPQNLLTNDYGANANEILLFGHTHLQFGIKQNNAVYINPGSVGMPRNGDFRAHGVSFDTATHELQYHKINYDLERMIDFYVRDKDVNPLFFHNVNFGRSSKRKLKYNPAGVLDQHTLNNLKSKNINIINTKFGAVLGQNNFSSASGVVYIALYEDEKIEVTTSALQYNWQHRLRPQLSIKLPDNHILSDNAGSYFHKVIATQDNLLPVIEAAFDTLKTIL